MMLVGLTSVMLFGFVLGEYPPRGYRPPGRPFELPQREYGSPKFALPTLEPVDFRGGQTQQFDFQQRDNAGLSRSFQRNREYGAPADDTVTIQAGRIGQNRFHSPSSGAQSDSMPVQPGGIRQNSPALWNQQDGDSIRQIQQYGFTSPNQGTLRNQQHDTLAIPGSSITPNQQYGFTSPSQGTLQNQQDDSLAISDGSVRQNQQHGINSPSRNRNDNTLAIQAGSIRQNQQYGLNSPTQRIRQGDTRQSSLNERQRQRSFAEEDDADVIGAGNQNYLPPTPKTEMSAEPRESDIGDGSSVAVSNAFARNQYYLIQPNQQFQRLTADDSKSNGLSSKLIVQNLAPFTAPVYGYTSPLIRLI